MNSRTVAFWSVLALTLGCGGQADEVDQADDVQPPSSIPSDREPTRVVPPVPIVPEPMVMTDTPDPVDDEPATPAPVSNFDQLQQAVFQILDTKCGSCHGAEAVAAGNVQGEFDCIEDMDCLVQTGYISPGYSENSLIVQRMRDGTMPPRGVQPLLTDADIEQVAKYIRFPLWWGE